MASAGGERGRVAQAVLHFAVALLSALLLVVLAGLVLVQLRPSWLAGLRNAIPAKPPAFSPPTQGPGKATSKAKAPAGSVPPGPTVGSGFVPVATTIPAIPPTLLALQPATGVPGDTVLIVGSDLFSPDGTVLVSFGDKPAHTRCPTKRRCLVTVPDEGASGRHAAVRVRTAGGLSNALPFRYR